MSSSLSLSTSSPAHSISSFCIFSPPPYYLACLSCPADVCIAFCMPLPRCHPSMVDRSVNNFSRGCACHQFPRFSHFLFIHFFLPFISYLISRIITQQQQTCKARPSTHSLGSQSAISFYAFLPPCLRSTFTFFVGMPRH